MGGICGDCQEPAELRCARCKKVFYCDRVHQKRDWKGHKKSCYPLEIDEKDLHFSIYVAVDQPEVEVDGILNHDAPPGAKLEAISVVLEGINIPTWENLPEFTKDNIPEILKETTLKPYDCSLYKFFQLLFVTEPQERQKEEKLWYGGIDTHHVYYEGGFPPGIRWGS